VPPSPTAPPPTVIAPIPEAHFKRLIAQLQVRIDKLEALQRGRSLVLADPVVRNDALRWRRLLSEFEAGQENLDELGDQRASALAGLESLQDRDIAPQRRIVQRLSASAIRARIGRRVRDLRVRRGLAQEELASLAGLPGYALPSIETGDKTQSLEALVAISYALDLSLSELFLGVDAATPEAERIGEALAQSAGSHGALALVELALAVATTRP
jgi:transcriptional regulator with XRE-family HTH domain